MIAGIAKLMRAPLARMPGPRGLVARRAPELCALLVYVVTLATALALVAGGSVHPVRTAAIAGYGLYSLVLVTAAAAGASLALVAERERGTLDALLLTSRDHAGLLAGRYWHALAPWTRLVAWALPLYLINATNGATDVEGGRELLGTSTAYVLGLKPAFMLLLYGGIPREGVHPCWGGLLMLCRLAADLLTLRAVTVIAYYVSARARTGMRAVLLSYVAVLGAYLTVFAAAEWAALFAFIFTEWGDLEESPALIYLYLAAKLLVTAGEGLVAWLGLRVIARRFDLWLE